MKNLARHIELLLLDNECVIIPQFGGFVTQYKDIEYLDEDAIFMPPSRTVGFNEKLQGNDGLLVASFMETYCVAESEAKRMIHAEVLEMRQQLLENGTYDFGSLGLLNQNEDGEISFSPCAAGVSTPDFYGLDVLEFPRLQLDAGSASRQYIQDYKPLLSKDERGFTINISHKAVHQLATMAAAILLFFFFATPIRNVNVSHSEDVVGKSVMLASSFLVPQMSVEDFCVKASEYDPLVVSDTVVLTTDTTKVKVTVSDANVVEPVPTASTKTSSAVLTSKEFSETVEEYAVVVASSIPESNASLLIEQLQDKGFPGATIFRKGKMVRVVFRGFKTEQEAQIKKNRLRDAGTDFKGVWILKLNE